MHLGKHKFSYRNSVIRIIEFIDQDTEELRYCTDALIYSYDSLDSLISDYKKLIDKRLRPKERIENNDFDIKSIFYKGYELELERDRGKIVSGFTYDLYNLKGLDPVVRFKGKLKDLRNQFEKYVDDYFIFLETNFKK